jgi:hypothetical protein
VGGVVRLRTLRRSDRRWEATFKRAAPSEAEKAALAKAIGDLRRRELPLPGDWEVAMMPIVSWVNYQHAIAGTSRRVTYNFDDGSQVLALISLHRG